MQKDCEREGRHGGRHGGGRGGPDMKGRDMFKMADMNRDGRVDKNEFMNAMSKMPMPGGQVMRPDMLSKMFDMADRDRNGYISMKEAESMDNQSPEQQAQNAMMMMDKNRDGRISEDEFVNGSLSMMPPNAPRDQMEKNMRMTFKVMDKNKDGYMDMREF